MKLDGSMHGTSPAPRDIWMSVFLSDPHAMPSQSPQWIDAICDNSIWSDASRLYITDSGRRIVFPITRLGLNRLAGYVSPVRGWGYGGIIADGGVTADDVALVSRDLFRRGMMCLRVRPNPLQAAEWKAFLPTMRRIPKLAYVLDLSGGIQKVSSQFHPSAKKGLKAAAKNRLRAETAPSSSLLPLFFDLAEKSVVYWAKRQNEPVWLAQLRRRFGESREKWNKIAKHLGPEMKVTVVWHGDRPAAAGIVLQTGNAHGIRAAWDPDLRYIGANHLVNLVALENACAAGAGWFHMGESATPGAAAFKEFLGARPCAFDEFEHEVIPYWRTQEIARAAVKRLIGFRDGGRMPSADNREQGGS